MMAYKKQTDVADSKTIRIGSVKFEIGTHPLNGEGFTDIGALRNATFRETFDTISVKSDNAGVIEEGIQNHVVEIAGDWCEINIERLGEAFAGIGADSDDAGGTTARTHEPITLVDNDFVAFAHKNYDGSEVTLISIDETVVGGKVFVRDCDYVVTTLPNGDTGIARADEVAIVTAIETVTVAEEGKTYTDGDSGFGTELVPGDHIYVTGFSNATNNGIKTIVTATTAILTVSETCVDAVAGEGEPMTAIKGGIVSGTMVYANYTSEAAASRTFKAGGTTARTAQVLKLTNTNVANLTWIMYVYKAYIMEGINLTFLPDDDPELMVCPIRYQGVLDPDRDSGDQLFSIVDTQDTD